MAVVLVVDTRRASRELVARVLHRAGHRVFDAANSHEAREAIRVERPDLVIMGVLTPRMDGFDFVRRLRADPVIHQPSVVFCTATYLASQVRELCDACGVPVAPATPSDMLNGVTAVFEGDAEASGTPVSRFDRTVRLLSQRLLEKDEELGEARRSRSRLLGDLLTAEEAERRRIAAAVHDDSIQVMSAAALRLDTLALDLTKSEHADAAGEVADKVRAAVVRLRGLIFDLSPPSLTPAGLGSAIATYLREAGADADFRWRVEDRLRRDLPQDAQVILFWIAREAIRNARKHAHARALTVTLSEHDGCGLLRIADDGVGFLMGRRMDQRPGHLGLRSMRERTAAAGGSFQLETAPSAGCVIEVWVPLAASLAPRPPSDSPLEAVRRGEPVTP